MLKKVALKWEKQKERVKKLTFFDLEFRKAKKLGHLAIRVSIKYTFRYEVQYS